MARKYVNPAKSAPPVDDKLLDEARAKAEVTAAQLREAERGDPLAPSWPAEYEAATAAARAASRAMDGVAQGRALRTRAESKYGDIGQMYDRLAARSALSARVWCLDGT